MRYGTDASGLATVLKAEKERKKRLTVSEIGYVYLRQSRMILL